MQKIAYEQHPVSPERKAELREAGFKIVDERFKPDSESTPEKGKRPYNRKPKAEDQAQDDESEQEDSPE